MLCDNPENIFKIDLYLMNTKLITFSNSFIKSLNEGVQTSDNCLLDLKWHNSKDECLKNIIGDLFSKVCPNKQFNCYVLDSF